jgi:hypothetical protein
VISGRVLFFIFLICCIFAVNSVCATEIAEGNIRLVLNQRTGRFSLYYLSDAQRYVPLFNNQDRYTYASISVNGNVHRLGDRQFRHRFDTIDANPAFIFESSSLTVTQVFSPVATVSSDKVNGIMITFTVQNTSDQDHTVGLRFLLDTDLGDGRRGIPFETYNRIIASEAIVTTEDKYWISRGQNIALMGSIINPADSAARVPDFVHIANWKRLNDVSWELRLSEGRTFSRDSAVCYYFEPNVLESGGFVSYTIFLTTEDIEWYTEIHETDVFVFDIEEIEKLANIEAEQSDISANLIILVMLQELLNQFIDGKIDLEAQDLLEIESAINRHRN